MSQMSALTERGALDLSIATLQTRVKEREAEIERLRAALLDSRDFVAGMIKQAASGIFTISSYHPCRTLLDKIDAAMSNQQLMPEPK